jgi:hypothetical protein
MPSPRLGQEADIAEGDQHWRLFASRTTDNDLMCLEKVWTQQLHTEKYVRGVRFKKEASTQNMRVLGHKEDSV